MTVAVIVAGLLPIMFGDGTGSEVMRRIAAPMVGGMITAPVLSMIILPVVYLLLHRRAFAKAAAGAGPPAAARARNARRQNLLA
jgi:Cu(I)/Ag(I) efflux system membrane protein CusA/SilA